jgi:hypothetical protein
MKELSRLRKNRTIKDCEKEKSKICVYQNTRKRIQKIEKMPRVLRSNLQNQRKQSITPITYNENSSEI